MVSLDMADANRLMAELRQTAGELQRELRALATASEQLTAITAKDEKGAVALTLGANGSVQSLVLDEDWRDTIGEESLGTAVSACYQDAVGQRAGQFMKAYTESADDQGAATPIPAPEPVRLGDPSSSWGIEGREKLREMYAAADAEQEDFLAHRAQRARQARDGVNAAKTVTVTREGDTITAVHVDERWVRNTNDEVIEKEIVRAMNNVMAMSARERENKYEGFPAIEQLAKIAHNPHELMRRMGAIR
jgi:DNA-binding protein YbaB